MTKVLLGKAWCFPGVMDVDWEICPVEHLHSFREDSTITYEQRLNELGQYCMNKVDPDFAQNVNAGDFIIGGKGFGYGHDHDHACMSIRGAGVAAVLCEATNSNFMRNSIHHGIPVVEVRNIIRDTKNGDRLEVYLAKGIVHNLSNNKTSAFEPYPDFLIEIIEAGGLYPLLESQVKAGIYS
jgi:3-isopropylmalate/(R)-2-methylmalate dehydratase small subunit